MFGLHECQLFGKKYVFLPFVSLRYCAIAVFVAALFLVAIEYFTQRACSVGAQGLPAAYCLHWKNEDRNIDKLNRSRIVDRNTSIVWRSRLHTVSEPPRVRRRILAIGDSYVEGDGLTNVNLTWWRQLQRELERRGYWDIEVVAAGRNCASTQAQLRWIANNRLIDRLKPDLVVVGFVSNDPDIRNETGARLIRQLSGDMAEQCLPSIASATLAFVPLLHQRLKDMCQARNRSIREKRGEGYGYRNWVRKLYEPAHLKQYAPIVSRFSKGVRERGLELLVVALPKPLDRGVNGRPVYERVGEMFTKSGARWLDLWNAFNVRYQKNAKEIPGMFANPANTHPGAVMTHFYATQIVDTLEIEYRKVLGRRSATPDGLAPRINDAVPMDVQLEQSGANAWDFRVLGNSSSGLNWPVDEKHVHLSFERPVSIQSISFAVPISVKLRVFAHFMDEVGGHAEAVPKEVGNASGRDFEFRLSPEDSLRRVSSLRIAASPLKEDRAVEWELKLDSRKISKAGGNAFVYALPGIPYAGADVKSPRRQPLVLFEGSRLLGPGAAAHKVIRKHGLGSYSHWNALLYFSSSDNSDPKRNGREYWLRKFESFPKLKMTIGFGKPAVRP